MIQLPVVLFVVGVFPAGLGALLIFKYGSLWLQSYFSRAHISRLSLLVMRLGRVNLSSVVTAKVMNSQAGIEIVTGGGISTARLEAHVLAGGDLMRVLRAPSLPRIE